MTEIINLCELSGETCDDMFIRHVYKAYRGKEGSNEKSMGRLFLVLGALAEVDNLGDFDDKFNEEGWKLVQSDYNKSESVLRDLELHDYGRSPFPRDRFSYLDFLAIIGKLGDKKAGVEVSFFPGSLSLTRTLAFAEDESVLGGYGSQMFALRNYEGNSAYSETGRIHENVDLTKYGLDGSVYVPVSRGQLEFKDPKGKFQTPIVNELMNCSSNCEENIGFVPERFSLRHYDFNVDFQPSDGNEVFKQCVKSISEKVGNVMRRKLEQVA